MHIFKLIYLTIADLAKQAWLLPQTIGIAFQRRRGQSTRRLVEAERLDRIRHPSKYLGR